MNFGCTLTFPKLLEMRVRQEIFTADDGWDRIEGAETVQPAAIALDFPVTSLNGLNAPAKLGQQKSAMPRFGPVSRRHGAQEGVQQRLGTECPPRSGEAVRPEHADAGRPIRCQR